MTEIMAAVTVGIALIGLYFTFQQRRNDRLKIRLEVYPKKVAIFKRTDEFLAMAWTGNYLYMPDLLADFYRSTREAHFLFDKKLAAYLDSLYEGVDHHFHLETKLEIQSDSLDFGEKRALQSQVFASRHWLGQQSIHIKERFAKYLNLNGFQ